MSTKYTFKSEFTGYETNDIVTTTKEFHADSIDAIVEEFKAFLLGTGFHPVDVVRTLGDN